MSHERRGRRSDIPVYDEVIENTVEEVEVEVVEEAPAIPTKLGVVFGCSLLNIRREPSIDSDIVGRVSSGVELMVDPDYTNVDWYKVHTEAGLVGYCMKNYVRMS